jgi:nitrogen fixation protein FixH
MNWGLRITILYLGFIALILTLVFTSMHSKEDLVSKDYYLQELRYEERIDAIKNYNALNEGVTYFVKGNNVEVVCPKSLLSNGTSGEIVFFRPSDAAKDVRVAMNFDKEGKQSINGKLVHGVYKMQFSWKKEKKNYFKEEVIFIQ